MSYNAITEPEEWDEVVEKEKPRIPRILLTMGKDFPLFFDEVESESYWNELRDEQCST